MRTWAKGSTSAAFLAVGVMALGSGTAYAGTDGTGSIGGGNQVNIPITLPIDISGNAVAVAGESEASSRGGASVEGSTAAGGNRTSGRHSILGGNQVVAPITAPVNVCGNAVSLFGESEAGCKGGAEVKGSRRGGAVAAGGNRTSGRHSVLGGNQVVAPITAPINLCGNSVAIFGDATAGCKGGASVSGRHSAVRAGGNRTSGRSSVLGGNQVVAPITAPVNVCGNSVAVIGEAFSGCQGGSSVGGGRDRGHRGHDHDGHGHDGNGGGRWSRPGSSGHDTDGRFSTGGGTQVVAPIKTPVEVCGNGSGSQNCHGGRTIRRDRPGNWSGGNRTSGTSSIGGGNQVVAPVTVPINICGNAIAIAGDAFAGCRGGATVKSGWGRHGYWGAGGNRTSGRHSILGGNQVVAPITAPINVCGNAVALLGKAAANCKGGSSVSGGVGGGGNITSGRYGILAGNQLVAPITAPINVCGNSVAVLGDAAAGCLGGARVGGKGWHRGHGWSKAHNSGRVGMMRETPALPMLSGLKEASGLRQEMSSAAAPSAPILGDLANMKGMSGLPSLPVADTVVAKSGAAKGNTPVASQPAGSLPVGDTLGQATRSLPVNKTVENASGGLPVRDLTRNLPTGDLKGATDLLPLGDLNLMSAEQPVGLTGMNPASFAALVLGAMFAASASLFALTRRVRLRRK
ncbi:chaplin family protein [Sphaerimonospora mesophila]|uniref:chaplin family protein n=1 Tax=Sphaerimonospora mesophila TaxID=37483 RepID=UPI0006E43206